MKPLKLGNTMKVIEMTCKCDGLTVMKNGIPYCSKCGKRQVS